MILHFSLAQPRYPWLEIKRIIVFCSKDKDFKLLFFVKSQKKNAILCLNFLAHQILTNRLISNTRKNKQYSSQRMTSRQKENGQKRAIRHQKNVNMIFIQFVIPKIYWLNKSHMVNRGEELILDSLILWAHIFPRKMV